jgi:hypothetical protein
VLCLASPDGKAVPKNLWLCKERRCLCLSQIQWRIGIDSIRINRQGLGVAAQGCDQLVGSWGPLEAGGQCGRFERSENTKTPLGDKLIVQSKKGAWFELRN